MATSVELSGPLGVYVDKAGNVLIGDSGNQRVRKVTGTSLTTIIGGRYRMVATAGPDGGDVCRALQRRGGFREQLLHCGPGQQSRAL